jgi:hypothetical protein
MSKDIYQILESLDAAQKSVKQLPALFKPKDTSPQIAGAYPGKNATLGYLVGEGDEQGWGSETGDSGADETPDGVSPDTQSFLDEEQESNPMAQAVTRRIVNQHPEWITRYGVEALMQAIDDVTEGEDDWEEIGSSDVSAYVHRVKDYLDDRMGSREEMDDRKPFAEGQDNTIYQVSRAMLDNNPGKSYLKASEDDILRDAARELSRMGMSDIRVRSIMRDPDFAGELIDTLRGPITESATTEDVISTVKKKLGDYLSDLTKEIKKDPDLKDKLEKDIDQIGPAVKTIKTDDGHEIKIHGNEDDGFRITIKNREAKTRFSDLDEAVMACEMYCSRRRGADMKKDYLEER